MTTEIHAQSLLRAMYNHIGEAAGVSCRDLAIEIQGYSNSAAERRIRGAIKDLRTEGYHVCGTPETGYFMAKTAEELDRTCRFLVSRAEASLSQVANMKRMSMPDLHGQFRLNPL